MSSVETLIKEEHIIEFRELEFNNVPIFKKKNEHIFTKLDQ